jgi:hypothetical protein
VNGRAGERGECVNFNKKLHNPGKEPETGRLSRRLRAGAISYTVPLRETGRAKPVEEFLRNLGSGGIWLGWLPNLGHFLSLPPEAFSVSAVYAALGAVILGKFTAKVGAMTLPLNYAALLAGALIANWALSGVHLPVGNDLQAPIIFAIVGMTPAAVMMMAFLRN